MASQLCAAIRADRRRKFYFFGREDFDIPKTNICCVGKGGGSLLFLLERRIRREVASGDEDRIVAAWSRGQTPLVLCKSALQRNKLDRAEAKKASGKSEPEKNKPARKIICRQDRMRGTF